MRNRFSLLLILCALASLFAPSTASADTLTSAETCVGAFELPDHVHVAGAAALTSEPHQGCELADYDSASDSLLAAKGLAGNPMFRNALQPFKGGLTNAGRALAKHPNIVGADGAQALMRQFGNNAGVNQAAAAALKNIMRNGAQTTKATKAFGQVVEFTLPSGLGARFSASTNQFIGFLGRGL